MDGKVGMIGVGVMGFAMARNLRQAGFDVVGYDPAPGARERLAEIGGTVVEAPRLVAEACPTIILSLPSAKALADAVGGENGLAAASARGTVAIECSTLPLADKKAALRRSGRRRKDPAGLPPQRDWGPGRGQGSCRVW